MKQLFTIIFITISFINYSFGQTIQVKSENDQKVYDYNIIENKPEYPDGEHAMMQWIAQNVKYPEIAKNKKIQGKVFVRFIITETGKVDSVTVLKSIHPLLDEEAIRVIKLMPDWKPGSNKGKIVNCSFLLPINFKLNN